MIKLIESLINHERKSVHVRCWLNVQGIDHPITFTLQEADLYAAAKVRGEDSWDNEDLISVAQTQVGLTVQEPA
jgi:hypothetical protein